MVAAVYVPYFFISKYALDLGVDPDMAFYIISCMNTMSVLGRFPPNLLADRYGGINVLLPTALGTIVVLFCFPLVHTLAGLIFIGISYCLITGGMVSIPALTIANLTEDPTQYGTRIGMGYSVAALGALIGNPIAGAAKRTIVAGTSEPRTSIDRNGLSASEVQDEYRGPFYFAAGCMAIATILMGTTRLYAKGRKLKAKI